MRSKKPGFFENLRLFTRFSEETRFLSSTCDRCYHKITSEQKGTNMQTQEKTAIAKQPPTEKRHYTPEEYLALEERDRKSVV